MRHAPPAPQRYQIRRLPAASPSLDDLVVGMAVYDSHLELPGVIDAFYGAVVKLIRPAGFTWESRRVSIRPATEYERNQLKALAKHHRSQLIRDESE